ncbi:uncharacterized protein B0I36DRAFT_388228 [Microdochium trichocladiopsis]|uniref:pyruvate, water dikinase n=1 Tax=Microdochium trichocladiopsis TaxID=1682393 RepID=A0A9P9BKU1_9PEZI|nr:uncharacterized protein B0I36DRAFT_388228 [Microdochium trichocladiopsis]KAH7021566.1 hypothetical protein B0I36DRAFT_388228 [Microdochium trichocladiopsis]
MDSDTVSPQSKSEDGPEQNKPRIIPACPEQHDITPVTHVHEQRLHMRVLADGTDARRQRNVVAARKSRAKKRLENEVLESKVLALEKKTRALEMQWYNEPPDLQSKMEKSSEFVRTFRSLSRMDVALVGGKNASLGEMISALDSEEIAVPHGFATTSHAYWQFVEVNGIRSRLEAAIDHWRQGKTNLVDTGHTIRSLFLGGSWPGPVAAAIEAAYHDLGAKAGMDGPSVAVRSSATAEDLPTASFAGQQESYLNIRGAEELPRSHHTSVALSVGVQHMVRANRAGGGAGVMFTIDPESGYDQVVLINASWGLGETVVQGTVDPDEYEVFKPLIGRGAGVFPVVNKTCGSKAIKMVYGGEAETDAPTTSVPTTAAERASFVLSDHEILQLGRWACAIERHYGCAMDIEWARDGVSGDLFVVQARPETVHSQMGRPGSSGEVAQTYVVREPGPVLATGHAIGTAAVAGRVCHIASARHMDRFVDGSILVTEFTDPDWLGVPAIVGCGNATRVLHPGQDVTVDCSRGTTGYIHAGQSQVVTEILDLAALGPAHTKVMLNLADPAAAYRWWRLPHDGVGLARMEFVISSVIQVHPMALLHYDELPDGDDKRQIARLTAAPAIIRMSDFKTNEYARLLGGAIFEPAEENPMLGLRGAARYYSPRYRDSFGLECRAIQQLRDHMGFTNAIAMIPFCRTVDEAQKVLEIMAGHGLGRDHGVNNQERLQVYVMCEVPSNVILANDFAAIFDGFSIGSNDLTQLTLGVDRDSSELAALFDEQDPAVKWMIERVITAASATETKIGFCGQAPSDDPTFARFLVSFGDRFHFRSPDSFVAVKRNVAEAEAARKRPGTPNGS